MANETDNDLLSTRQSDVAMQDIVDRVESFLVRQIDRLEGQMDQARSPQQLCESGEIDAILSEFEATKSDWHTQYESQRVELEEDCQRLAEAWERVENEQRQLLAARSIQQTVGASTPIATGEASPDLRNKTPTSLIPATGSIRKSTSARDPASHTFKQLQQQIRAHNKRRQ